MSVKKRKDGRWRVDVAVIRDGKRQRFRKAAKTRSEGLVVEREIRAKLEQGIAPTTKAPLFSEWAEDFLTVYATNNNKPSEIATKRSIVELHLLPFFGSIALDRIGTETVERFKATRICELCATPKEATIRRIG